MDIGKSNDNFRDRKPKCFNYNKYRHIAKECQSKKKKDKLSQIRYSLVVILELNGVLKVQYKEIMIIDDK